jgi:anaphase-promoting complex subunit 10
MGKNAAWSVSSCKPGNGVTTLRDDNLETYWQSDGLQPHLINIQFQKKVKLQLVVLYVDFKLDESYTPSKISIRAGDGFHNLKVISFSFEEEERILLACEGLIYHVVSPSLLIVLGD